MAASLAVPHSDLHTGTWPFSQKASISVTETICNQIPKKLTFKACIKRATCLERAHECLINGHHAASVVKFATVVGRREKRHQLSLGEEFIAVFDNLVRSAYQVQIVSI